jgi:hypothetical protein
MAKGANKLDQSIRFEAGAVIVDKLELEDIFGFIRLA